MSNLDFCFIIQKWSWANISILDFQTFTEMSTKKINESCA